MKPKQLLLSQLNLPLETLARLTVGGVLIWSGLTKIGHPLEFARAILNYRLFPESLALLGAIVLPWLELLIGLGLITRIFRQGASFLAVCLFGGFIVIITITIFRGINTECGCFGSLSRQVGLPLLIGDIFLWITSLYLFLLYQKKSGLASHSLYLQPITL